MPKPFAWSWSKLKNFRACPKRNYHVDIARDTKEPESEQLLWGNKVHDGLAVRIGKGKPLPVELDQYEHYAASIDKYRGTYDIKTEQDLAVDAGFKPVGWFDATTWLRVKIDVLVSSATRAAAFDWKTGGKVNPDLEQLGITATVVMAHYPQVTHVDTSFEWLGHDVSTIKTYERGGMLPFWNDLMPEIRIMEEAHRTMTYPPKPGRLCRNWCPVSSCPFHGKSHN